ncbi:MAG TPA: thioredoxin family protein [candidate division Zixibacteria bacterium]
MKNRTILLVILAITILIVGLFILKQKNEIGLGNKPASLSESAVLSENSSDTLNKNLPALIDLGRGTCKACKMMQPILEELSEEYKGRATIRIVDIRYEPEQANFYNIRLIPTQIFFDSAGNEVYRHEGFMDKLSIQQKLLEIGVK